MIAIVDATVLIASRWIDPGMRFPTAAARRFAMGTVDTRGISIAFDFSTTFVVPTIVRSGMKLALCTRGKTMLGSLSTRTRRRGMQTTSTAKLTYADFLSFPDDGQRHELVGGRHYVTPSPMTKHQRVVGRMLVALDAYLSATGLGEVFVAPLDVLLSDHDVVEPDVFVILAGQDILTDKHVVGAPGIVIEIASPATRRRDRGVKRNLYDRTGVREYWMVDPDGGSATLFRRTPAGALTDILSIDASASITSPLLPAFTLALTALFK
jgi:Uma2 family endonuclease